MRPFAKRARAPSALRRACARLAATGGARILFAFAEHGLQALAVPGLWTSNRILKAAAWCHRHAQAPQPGQVQS